MTELDMKILKRKLEVPWSCLTADEGHAVIAALEDREQLRAALDELVNAWPIPSPQFTAALEKGRGALGRRDD